MTERRPTQAAQADPARYPSNVDAERAVLGAVLLDNHVLPAVAAVIRPDAFFQSGHQITFQKMLDLAAAGKPVELTLLTDELRRESRLEEAGGYIYLAGLEHFVMATSAAVDHARLVKEKATLRRIMAAAETILREAGEERRSPKEQVEVAFGLFNELARDADEGKGLRPVEDCIGDHLLKVMADHEPGARPAALDFPWGELNKIVSARPGDYILIAARPSIGKTSFATQILTHTGAKTGRPTAFFSSEMKTDAILTRMACQMAGVNQWKITHGRASPEEQYLYKVACNTLMGLGLHIDETGSVSPHAVLSRTDRLRQAHPDLAMVAIDYIQLMSPDQSKQRGSWQNRNNEVQDISRALKRCAMENSVPLLGLCQLSRAVEQRGDGARPKLSDLRDSGSLEQDADVVIFLHRETPPGGRRGDVASQMSEAEREAERLRPKKVEVIVAKNRNGPIGETELMFIPPSTAFHSISRSAQ